MSSPAPFAGTGSPAQRLSSPRSDPSRRHRGGPDRLDLSATIHLLGEALGDVLRTQESADLFETEERIRSLAKARRSSPGTPVARDLAAEVAALSVDAARSTASAFAVYFDLVNLAEEAERIRALRERERSTHPAPIGESIGAAIRDIKSQGVSADVLTALLATLRIE